jgi:hypothetical protein
MALRLAAIDIPSIFCTSNSIKRSPDNAVLGHLRSPDESEMHATMELNNLEL